jgi:membrane-associated phospholipid phosphatase
MSKPLPPPPAFAICLGPRGPDDPPFPADHLHARRFFLPLRGKTQVSAEAVYPLIADPSPFAGNLNPQEAVASAISTPAEQSTPQAMIPGSWPVLSPASCPSSVPTVATTHLAVLALLFPTIYLTSCVWTYLHYVLTDNDRCFLVGAECYCSPNPALYLCALYSVLCLLDVWEASERPMLGRKLWARGGMAVIAGLLAAVVAALCLYVSSGEIVGWPEWI